MKVRSVSRELGRVCESVWEEVFECYPRSSVRHSRISVLLVIQVGVSDLVVFNCCCLSRV